jgi:hypothetical protein
MLRIRQGDKNDLAKRLEQYNSRPLVKTESWGYKKWVHKQIILAKQRERHIAKIKARMEEYPNVAQSK